MWLKGVCKHCKSGGTLQQEIAYEGRGSWREHWDPRQGAGEGQAGELLARETEGKKHSVEKGNPAGQGSQTQ